MKIVLAFVQPFKLDDVTRSRARIDRFPAMTVSQVQGFGREHAELAPGSMEGVLADFTDKVQIQIVVHEEQVDDVVQAIARTAHTGHYGDGMVFVLPVERAVRIATLREGEDAV